MPLKTLHTKAAEGLLKWPYGVHLGALSPGWVLTVPLNQLKRTVSLLITFKEERGKIKYFFYKRLGNELRELIQERVQQGYYPAGWMRGVETVHGLDERCMAPPALPHMRIQCAWCSL